MTEAGLHQKSASDYSGQITAKSRARRQVAGKKVDPLNVCGKRRPKAYYLDACIPLLHPHHPPPSGDRSYQTLCLTLLAGTILCRQTNSHLWHKGLQAHFKQLKPPRVDQNFRSSPHSDRSVIAAPGPRTSGFLHPAAVVTDA